MLVPYRDLPNEFSDITARYFRLVSKKMGKRFTTAVQAEIFGRANCINDKWNRLNDFVYLYILLSIAYGEKQEVALFSACPVKEITDLRTDFKFDCLIEYFKCLGFNAQDAIDLFGLEATDGINFMQIEGDGSCNPPFIVR